MTEGLNGRKILVTGPTGQVAEPIMRALAPAGVTCVALDLTAGDFSTLPDDFDHVLNFAVVRGGDADFDRDIAANAEATGLLMGHCRRATSFLHCSSTAVYEHQGPSHPLRESDPLGDNHRVMMPTYSICKIAAEAVARSAARQWNLPTTIA